MIYLVYIPMMYPWYPKKNKFWIPLGSPEFPWDDRVLIHGPFGNSAGLAQQQEIVTAWHRRAGQNLSDIWDGDSETNDICRKHIYISKRIMCVLYIDIYYIVNKDKHKLIILFYLLLLWQNCNFVGVDAFWILSGADSGAPWPPAPRLLGCLWAVGLRWSP